MIRYSVPCTLIAFCLLAFWRTTQFDRVPPLLVRGLQPSDFPQLVLLLIIFLSVLVMSIDTPVAYETTSRTVWNSMGLLLGFAVVAQLDLFLGLGVFAAALARLWGEKRLWAILIVAVVSPALIFLLFDQVFQIRFPRGLLTTFWYG